MAEDTICDVEGCNNPSMRSLGESKVTESSLVLKSGKRKRVHLCKEHYKKWKKEYDKLFWWKVE